MNNTSVKDSFICYFDLLGYKEYIASNNENQYLKLIDSIVCKILSGIADIKKELVSVGANIFGVESYQKFENMAHGLVEYRIFSDNVVLAFESTKIEYIDVKLLQILIKYIAELQAQLLLEYGTAIRGSIVRGNIYFDDNYVFGKGLVKAYTYENDVAIFPRIVIDKECDKLLKSESKLKCKLVEYISSDDMWINATTDLYDFIIKDFDGFSFVNYLFSDKVGKKSSTNKLELHKIKVLENVRTSESLKIYQKYSWAITYHNLFCEKYQLSDSMIIE